MKKIIIPLLVLTFGLFCYANANDNTGFDSGVSPNINLGRWQTTKFGPASSTMGVTAITNVISSTSALMGRLIVVPGAVTDVVEVHNSATAAAVSASTDIFKITATSQTLNSPVSYDFGTGSSGSSGLTVVYTISASSTTGRGYILWDKAK